VPRINLLGIVAVASILTSCYEPPEAKLKRRAGIAIEGMGQFLRYATPDDSDRPVFILNVEPNRRGAFLNQLDSRSNNFCSKQISSGNGCYYEFGGYGATVFPEGRTRFRVIA
jgi:hypothetical protein